LYVSMKCTQKIRKSTKNPEKFQDFRTFYLEKTAANCYSASASAMAFPNSPAAFGPLAVMIRASFSTAEPV